MDVERRLRDDLHRAELPSPLTPPPDLADTVLGRARHTRRVRLVVTAATAVAAATLAIPLAGHVELPSGDSHPAGTPTASTTASGVTLTDPVLPTPGGGKHAIHVLAVTEQDRISGSWIHDVSYVLDTSTGQYRRVPFRVLLSPDGTQAVVSSGTDVGLVSRSALLRDGGAAVRWTGLRYRERGPAWSPDGRAVLIGWDDDSRDFTVQRYDLATGRTTTKRLRLDGPTTPQKSSITWADDSQAYLVYRHPTDSHEPAVVECVEPDGTVIVRWETSTTPGAIGGRGMPGTGQRSPSGRLVIIDSSTWKSTSTVIDMSSGRIVDWLPAGVRPVGFLDEGTVAWLAPTWGYLDWKEKAVLVIADLSTDRVLRELEVPHPPTMTVTAVQLGSTEGLTGDAAARGFS